MKTVDELKQQPAVFLHQWESRGARDVYQEFAVIPVMPQQILFASYLHECYEGEAFVLFEEKGKLFEVSGHHCSCYGLEYQWEPEATTQDALRHRLIQGNLGGYMHRNVFAKELKEFLGVDDDNETSLPVL